MTQPATTTPWLSIVGIGEDGIGRLTTEAQTLIQSAEYVFGAPRHLSLVASLILGTARPWRIPFDPTFADLLACRGRAVCMLASGDPFQYGAGSSLAPHLDPAETITIPGISAFSLAAARLLWPLQQTILVSFCGRPITQIRRHLQPGARVIALSAGSDTPAEVAALLVRLGFARSRIHVLEAMGSSRERIRTTTAGEFGFDEVSPLNTIALEVLDSPGARILPRAAGVPDDWFEHGGQITKREIRALTVSALAPLQGAHLWDIGAGSGSVAIEWLLSDPTLSATAFERREDRAARIVRNANTFGVTNLQIAVGEAPQVLGGARAPDAVFVGGGVTTPGIIESVQSMLKDGGRLVVNAVSLESEAALIDCYKRCGGTLTRLSISRAAPIQGSEQFSAWRSAMPITQWIWEKTGAPQ
jgi:precorrin-6Y C5,15-methyltransferase (decarboxylating)